MTQDINLSISEVIKKYGLLDDRKKTRAYGQNFLTDKSILDRIASSAGAIDPSLDIVEIGPGPCGLTRSILEVFKNNKLICIEKDENLKELHSNFASSFDNKLEFVYDDATTINLSDVTTREVVVIGNLPYNVASQILLNFLKSLDKIDRMVLMFQKEVAERLAAKTGTKAYGRLSVISQLLCEVVKMFDIQPGAFVPAPKVTSSVVRLTRKNISGVDVRQLEKVTQICFSKRRKTIFTILKSLVMPDMLENILSEVGIDRMSRPENITPEQFLALSNRLKSVEKSQKT